MTKHFVSILRAFALGLALVTNLEFSAAVEAQERPRIEITPNISHVGRIDKAVFSPDGKRLASAGEDGTVKLWDLATGRLTHTLEGHRSFVSDIGFSRDGSRIASASHDGIKLWDAASGQYIRGFERKLTGGISSVSFSPDDSQLLSSGDDGNARIWDTATAQVVRTFKHGEKFRRMGPAAFSSDGARVLTAGQSDKDKAVKLWDARTGELLRAFADAQLGAGEVQAAFLADNSRVLVADGKTLTVWDTASGTALHSLEGRDLRGVTFIDRSKDGARLFAGGYGWTGAWNAKTGRRVNTFEPTEDRTKFISMSPDGALAVSGDKLLTLWDLATGEPVRDFVGNAHPVTAVGVSADGARLLAAGLGGAAGTWDVSTGKNISGTRLQGDFRSTEGVSAVIVARDGGKAAAKSGYSFGFWNAETGKLLQTFEGFAPSEAAAISADGAFVVTPANPPYTRSLASPTATRFVDMNIWNTATGKVAQTFETQSEDVASIAISANAGRIAWGGRGGTAYVLDRANGGKIIATLASGADKKYGNNITAMTLSPDGRLLLAAGYDPALDARANQGAGVKLWDIATGQLVRSSPE